MLKTLTSGEIGITILALLILLFSSFLFGKLFELIKAPKVVGEIFGGMVVGGSCFALLCPSLFQSIFNAYPEEGKVLNIFYQLGLIFLMFSSGYSTNISINKKSFKNHFLLFFGATIIPMVAAIPFVNLFHSAFIGIANNHWAFVFVFLISVSITSVPVISKIFFDIDMMGTKFSNMVLTVSTLQDLCLWILLNLSINIVETGELKVWNLILTTILTISLLLAAKLVEIIVKKYNWQLKKNVQPIALLITLGIIFLLSKLNVNIMYSAFIAGYIMKALTPDNEKINDIKDFSLSFFTPIYFALVGIQIDVIHNFSLSRFLLFFAIAFGLEFIGTVGIMWFTKLKRKTVLSLGITMNARGGPGIVLAMTAYAANIINVEFFTVLILVTMISSAIAGYWLRMFKNEIKDDACSITHD